ncbi:hypothetical protein QA601_08330 [Chitinispirillales bacterium ANBcel5]|uniref:phenylacetate--CoA ligase family protein n=1 Tax=Cellulosispirillum alkaliphilum TaxID=3039283 RepID=UPI002A564978|nr:hypothetical protein [Chitinispirillales bacterium ANBcel5]
MKTIQLINYFRGTVKANIASVHNFQPSGGEYLIFNPDYSWEFLSSDQIAQKTLRALRNHIAHLKNASPWYKNKLVDIDPLSVKSMDDFSCIPCTDRETVSSFMDSFVAVSPDEIVESTMSHNYSEPAVFHYTKNDLDRIAYSLALSFNGCSVGGKDVVQIFQSLNSLYSAGMAIYRGLSLLGCNVARSAQIMAQQQKRLMNILSPDVITGDLSMLKAIGTEINKSGDLFSTVKKIICTGESIRNPDMSYNAGALEVERLWGAELFSLYYSPESSVSFCECTSRNGAHCIPELVYAEVVDEQGRPVPHGTAGELVTTPLGVEGVPLLRFRTGDITFIDEKACSCGRNSLRIGPILGRKSHRINVGGSCIYPLSVTGALDSVEEVDDYVILIEPESSRNDRVSIHVAAPATVLEKIAHSIKAASGVYFPVLISNTNTIRHFRNQYKKNAKVIDLRKSALKSVASRSMS